MKEYLNIFIDEKYPKFIDKYLNTKTMQRLKFVTQFCGCDYTKIFSPLFLYTRYDHSLIVAHMTWHFTHDEKETVVALLHDAGTPCFAHCIDYVFGDYINQESSEKKIIDIVKQDEELMSYLKDDQIEIDELSNFDNYRILENKSPKLCTDRLDGVLHTVYIWLHTHSLKEIKEVYDNITVLQNEEGNREIGFKDVEIANKFVKMVYRYAKELQSNEDKYVMKYISEIVKKSVEKNLITIDDLYNKKEEEICHIFMQNFKTWKIFNDTDSLVRLEEEPNCFYVSFDTKKRNTIPLVNTTLGNNRINICSSKAKKIYNELEEYRDSKFAYVNGIEKIC